MTNPTVPSRSSFPHEIRASSLATERDQVVRELGSGGMATVLVAQVAQTGASDSLASKIHEFIHTELEDLGMTTRSEDAANAASIAPAADSGERLVLLSHRTPEGFAVTGAAVLRLPPGATYQHRERSQPT